MQKGVWLTDIGPKMRTSDPIDTSAPLPKCPDNSAPRQFGPNAETVRTIGPNTSVLGPDISALRETQQGQHGCDHAVYYTQTVSTEDSTLPGRSLIFTIALSCMFLCLQCFDAVGWAAGRASGL